MFKIGDFVGCACRANKNFVCSFRVGIVVKVRIGDREDVQVRWLPDGDWHIHSGTSLKILPSCTAEDRATIAELILSAL